MNWEEFIKHTGILYLLYYGINIMADLLWSGRPKGLQGEEDVLHFSEQVEPVLVESLPQPSKGVKEHEAPHRKKDELGKARWQRKEQDTEELTLREENINETTGGVFKMAELIPLAKAETIRFTAKLVF